MLFRVRATMQDLPGDLAGLTRRCGDAGLNILSLQVFPAQDGVTDELVLNAPDDWSDVDVGELVDSTGALQVSITRCTAQSLRDTPTRYLQAVGRILDAGSSVSEELADLLETDPPDVADYAGHDTIHLDDGPDRAIHRAVPFTPAERARAAALADVAGVAVSTSPFPRPALPARTDESPQVRESTTRDAPAITAMHARCSETSLYRRYHTPLPAAITPRMARRLAAPTEGAGLVTEVDGVVVGHAVAVPVDDGTSTWEIGVLVEDAWQRRGIGTMLVRNATRIARARHAGQVLFLTQPGNDAILRTIGRAGFRARIRREDGTVQISVGLGAATRLDADATT